MLRRCIAPPAGETSPVFNDFLSRSSAPPVRRCSCACHSRRVPHPADNLNLVVSVFSTPAEATASASRASSDSTASTSLVLYDDSSNSLRRHHRRKRRSSNSLTNLNNHNQLKIDWANLDKKEFMKLVGSLNVADLFAEVASDTVKYSEGAKKWHMTEYVLQRKDRRIFVGGQGFVLFVRRRQHSSSLAMKVCLHNTCRTRMERYQLKANLQIAAQRESRFISDLLVYYMTGKFFVSVMYKAKHSSLKVIKREIGQFPARFIKYYAACVLSAIFRLHRIGICHKDIKADNVLIDHRGVPQLADFGLAVECKVNFDGFLPNRRVTTMQYYPPECLILGGKTNDYKIDSWLFGFFISEIYIPSSSHMWTKFQSSCKEGWRFQLCESCHLARNPEDDALARLLRSLLRQDPHGRPSVKEAMRFPYFHDISWRQLESELPPDILHVRCLLTNEKGDVNE